MARKLLAQTLGSALVPSCFVLSQGAVRLLDAFPASAMAWYLNLAVFSPLQQVRAVPSMLATFLERAGTLELCLVLLLTAAVHIVRFRLGVAVLAHLAFAASLLVARAWLVDVHGTVSPTLLFARDASGTVLVVALLAATGTACALSHRSFILDIMRGDAAGRERSRQLTWPGVDGIPGDRAPALSAATRLSV